LQARVSYFLRCFLWILPKLLGPNKNIGHLISQHLIYMYIYMFLFLSILLEAPGGVLAIHLPNRSLCTLHCRFSNTNFIFSSLLPRIFT
jgi:hypothetical protein